MRAAALLLLLTAAAPASAAVISERPDRVAVVVYAVGTGNPARTGGLAMVSETRTLDLPAGLTDIQFRNVSATLVPQTAQLTGLEGLRERNFDFNLLTPGALLAKSVGQRVRLVRTNPGNGAVTEEAALVRSGPDGLVLETARGAEVVGCGGLNESIIFERMPENLLDMPALSVQAEVKQAGRYTLTLRYLATGLYWRANYVAQVRPDGSRLDLSGWITLTNAAETGFGNAPVDVVAGQVNVGNETRPTAPAVTGRSSQCWPEAALAEYEKITVTARRIDLRGFEAPTPVTVITVPRDYVERVTVRELGDLKLYALAEPTTLAPLQTKQIEFLRQDGVRFRRVYRTGIGPQDGYYGPNAAERQATPILRLTNSQSSGLGKPLPAGLVAINGFLRSVPITTGETRIEDTPVDLPFELMERPTNAVSAHGRIVSATRPPPRRAGDDGPRIERRSYEILITNRKAVAIDYEWSIGPNEATRVTAESRPHRLDRGNLVWPVRLAPGQQLRLTYALEWPG